jgi:hypothetical protein
MYIIYAKKKESDPVADYKGQASTWEECAEHLERLAATNEVVSFLNIDKSGGLMQRTWSKNCECNRG